jgi:hypothetical protein
MSGHTARFSRQFYHAPRTTVGAGAAAIILLALGACSSNSTLNTSAQPTPSTASFGVSGHRATLAGAGSTFDAPFFDLAFANYHQQHPSVSISYADVGSGAAAWAQTSMAASMAMTRGVAAWRVRLRAAWAKSMAWRLLPR